MTTQRRTSRRPMRSSAEHTPARTATPSRSRDSGRRSPGSTDTASGSGTVVAQCAPEIEVSLEARARRRPTRPGSSVSCARSSGIARFTEYDAATGRTRRASRGARMCSASSSSSATRSIPRIGSRAARSRRSRGRWPASASRSSSMSPGRRPDGRAVPVSFTVFFWDAESGALTATEAYRDEVAEVDGVFLPASGGSSAVTTPVCRCASWRSRTTRCSLWRWHGEPPADSLARRPRGGGRRCSVPRASAAPRRRRRSWSRRRLSCPLG